MNLYLPSSLDLNHFESKFEEKKEILASGCCLGSKQFGDAIAHELDNVQHRNKKLSLTTKHWTEKAFRE